MENYKINRIKELSDEVKQFHPFLRALLPKLPEITDVEYRQGPSEMGSDFLLTKTDKTLDSLDYIGCIVKTGQIKQDHSEINRQIEECEIERTIAGGTRKIFINQIWIICNDNITNGAQEKIHHKYKDKNIKFITAEKLVILTDKYYPDFWTDTSVQTGEYLREVKAIADSLSRNNSLIDINNPDIYIEQELIRCRSAKSLLRGSPPKSKRIKIEAALEAENFILIEAFMGTGKSTLISHLAKFYAENKTFVTHKTLPIIYSAKDLSDKHDGNVKDLIKEVNETSNLKNIDKYLILIDGLDEIKSESNERFELLEKVHTTAKDTNNVKIVITTRTIDDPETEVKIEKNYARYKLCSLTIKQVVSLVDKICQNSNIKNRLLKDLDKSHLFRVLPKTPISAILLAKLLNENIQEIPSTMTDLYNKYMELSLGRWDMQKGLQSQQEYDVINNVTICIAQFILDNSLPGISLGDARNIFYEYTDSRNLKIDKEAVFNKLKNKSEIFVTNKIKKTINFRHRTFAEYFYATGMERDNSAIISQSIYDLYWSTSYFFYIGLKRDCPAILKAIDEIELTEDRYKILKIFNHANFLLAAYLTPYEIIKKSVFSSFRETAQLYETITNEKTDNPLKKLPALQILCILTNTLCDTFGYDYFSDAIKERAYEIYTQPAISNLEYTELFLLNSVRICLNQQDSYDTMIEHYGNNIPLQIQAGMLEHAEYNKTTSTILKKYSKRFMKNVKTNIGFNNALSVLYDEPIEKNLEKRIKSEKKSQKQ